LKRRRFLEVDSDLDDVEANEDMIFSDFDELEENNDDDI